MSDEYISRKAVQNISTNKLKMSIRATIAGDDEAASRALTEAIEEILDLPPTDVKPVVRGEWDEIERGGLLIKYTLFRCMHCGNTFKVYEDTLNVGRGDKNFCPNCGADMRPRENLKAGAEYADADTMMPAT